ncbi:outer membrane receptor for ferric coprogen and ferric-rhodotorulic acid [Paucibacter oligotrophus]|uniref:Outer membrane receptor for ferric coprogen and ferric-rhodotorulic acid n=1 Tax=Roseateles oligotrophus TaxID=1769250 RepID=A0A840LIV8_9BURK|nr:TonB-dependent siderophore receptor [Roseateles oligotrophus]MBB4846148.1 outer membrane receptor for ferric coprogen and ferric-rhodotorulic acid [Roseateles oligotrophus]
MRSPVLFSLRPVVLAGALLCGLLTQAARADDGQPPADQAAASGTKQAGQPQEEASLPVVRMRFAREQQGDKVGPSRSSTGLNLSLRDTPQAISVITRERIEEGGFATLESVLRATPGLAVSGDDSGRSTISARGFAVENYRLDGLPFDASWGYMERLATAAFEKIEVTRGATGLMAGEGNPSASISMVRKRASAKALQGQVQLLLGTQNRRGGTLDLGSALNDSGSLRARVVAHAEHLEGRLDLEQRRTRQLLLVAEADLGPKTLLTLGHLYNHSAVDGGYWGGLPIFYSDGSRSQLPRRATTGVDWNLWHETLNSSYLKLEHRFDSQWRLQAELSRDMGANRYQMVWTEGAVDSGTGLGLTGVPYFYKSDRVQRNASVNLGGNITAFGRVHELNLGLQRLVAPANWTNRDLIGDKPAMDSLHNWKGRWTPPPVGELYNAGDNLTTQTAAYAAARLQLTDAAKLIVGARLSDYRHQQEAGAWNPVAYEVRRRNVLTPYGGLMWDLSESVSAYISHAGIFKNQTAKDREGKYLAPLEGVSQEIGLKGEWLDGALQGAATLFRVEQNNFAVADADFKIPGTSDPAMRGVQGVSSRGVELELEGRLTSDWRAGASFSHMKITHPLGEPVMSNLPRSLFKLHSQYALGGAMQGWHVGMNVNWQGADVYETTNPKTQLKERTGQDAYALLDLMLRWNINKQLQAQLNIDNALDKQYRQMHPWSDSYLVGAPRSVKLGLDMRF